MTFEYDVFGEEAEFTPIEATNVDNAMWQIRKIVANPSVWATGTGQFDATVSVWQQGFPRKQWHTEMRCAVASGDYQDVVFRDEE